VNVLARSPGVGAVAFAQADAEGRPWPAGMQPSTSAAPCVVAAFIGFAHLVRRDLFLSLGGYRESFHFYGEEKDFCLRLLHSGYRVAYLPDALVAHVPDMGNRSRAKHLRHLVRNDCLSSLYNEPWPLAILSLPIRLARHRSMCRAGHFKDPGGFRWIVSGLIATFPDVWRHRTPVSWESIKRWRALTRAPQPFEAARV
jgi:GT2 family glycosyltransferase